MGRTRVGRMDGRTDGQGGDYMLPRNFSRSIINKALLELCTKTENRLSDKFLQSLAWFIISFTGLLKQEGPKGPGSLT